MVAVPFSQSVDVAFDVAQWNALLRGEEAAVRAFYGEHARYVAGVLTRLLQRDQDLDDLVQETFLSALAGLSSLERSSSVRAFLATIAVRKALRLQSLRRRRRRLLSLFSFFGASESNPRTLEPAEAVVDALARLPRDLREPWVLSRIEDWTLPEVAAACRVSLATVDAGD